MSIIGIQHGDLRFVLVNVNAERVHGSSGVVVRGQEQHLFGLAAHDSASLALRSISKSHFDRAIPMSTLATPVLVHALEI